MSRQQIVQLSRNMREGNVRYKTGKISCDIGYQRLVIRDLTREQTAVPGTMQKCQLSTVRANGKSQTACSQYRNLTAKWVTPSCHCQLITTVSPGVFVTWPKDPNNQSLCHPIRKDTYYIRRANGDCTTNNLNNMKNSKLLGTLFLKSQGIQFAREHKESVFGLLVRWLQYAVFRLPGSDLTVAINQLTTTLPTTSDQVQFNKELWSPKICLCQPSTRVLHLAQAFPQSCHILGSRVLRSHTVDIGIPTSFLVNSELQCNYLS